MSDKPSNSNQHWGITIALAVIGALTTIGVTWMNRQPAASPSVSIGAPSPSIAASGQSGSSSVSLPTNPSTKSEKTPLQSVGATAATNTAAINTAATQPAGTPQQSVQAPRQSSLLGSWQASEGGCVLKIYQDDGKSVKGTCDAGVIAHKLVGQYQTEDANRVHFVITRFDDKGCETSVDGSLQLVGTDRVMFFQEGWKGCGVRTEPTDLLLRKL